MIATVAEVKQQISCGNIPDDLILVKMIAIEAVIRKYTNNNFQNRAIRFAGNSKGDCIFGLPFAFHIGNTVQISQSEVNDGLYTVVDVTDQYLQLDRELIDTEFNLVTKVQYPPDVVQCAINLYKWEQKMGEKVGIKSETISRHSVTYEDSSALYMGYPVGILNGLKHYRKARCGQ